MHCVSGPWNLWEVGSPSDHITHFSDYKAAAAAADDDNGDWGDSYLLRTYYMAVILGGSYMQSIQPFCFSFTNAETEA